MYLAIFPFLFTCIPNDKCMEENDESMSTIDMNLAVDQNSPNAFACFYQEAFYRTPNLNRFHSLTPKQAYESLLVSYDQ
jgi:hypothetical protein